MAVSYFAGDVAIRDLTVAAPIEGLRPLLGLVHQRVAIRDLTVAAPLKG